MVYQIINNTTKEILTGQWDAEYLYFVTETRCIFCNDYDRFWKPYEPAIKNPQSRKGVQPSKATVLNTISKIDKAIAKLEAKKKVIIIKHKKNE